MNDGAAVFRTTDLALLALGQGPLKNLEPPARLAIFGDPVAHSASPPMHNAALQARGLDLQYIRIRVTAEGLPGALENLAPAGFLGVSLTIPHKQAALPLMDEVTREASIIGAVNTVVIRDGKLHGHNTDGPGLAAAIHEEFSTGIRDKNVMILGGAGGAGRAIAVQCLVEGGLPVIANRNRTKGDLLKDLIDREWNDYAGVLKSIDMGQQTLAYAVESSEIIINATPLGMKAGDPSPLPEGLLSPHHLVYDTVYSGGETALLKQTREAGARCADGFSMLLHQGVLQHELWFGKPAPIEAMRSALMQIRN
jgi:shikimate dehydrogenase